MLRTLDDGGHAPEGQPHVLNAITREQNGKTATQRRNVAVKALADLVGAHGPGRIALRHPEPLNKLAGVELVLHVVQIERAEGHRSLAAAPAQADVGIERHEHGRTVANWRPIGDIAP